jgi:hypothetical protein
MAKQIGGPLGRTSGKVAGLVFGAARSRTGKVVTVREKVTPSNPNTPDQSAQRSIFKAALDRVKLVGPDVYSDDFNRAVGQLPGFQSMMSLLLKNRDAGGDFKEWPDVPLGDLHYPDTVDITTGGTSGNISFEWSTEHGTNGASDDQIVMLAIRADKDADAKLVGVNTSNERDDGGSIKNLTDLEPGENYVCVFYVVGGSSNPGMISKVTSKVVAAGS